MRTLAPRLLALALLLPACRQQVIVYDCEDAHDVDGAVEDGGLPADSGVAIDAGHADGGTPADGGGEVDAGCGGLCLIGVDVSAPVLDVREAATLTPRFEAPPAVAWTVSVDVAELGASRAANRPAFELGDADIALTGGADAATFMVRDVAPWFFETTFRITLHVREVGGGAEASAFADVKVRGNVLFSSGSEGHVYAVASDGRPATLNGTYPAGALLEQLVQTPRTLHLAADGALLVLDDGPDPARVHRFALTGKDVLLGNLEYEGTAEPIFRGDNPTVYGMAELSDGAIVVPEYQFAGVSSEPKSRLLVWDPAGAFAREVWAPSPEEEWRGAAATPDGKVLVADREREIVSRYDPATGWLPDGTFLDALPGGANVLLSTPDALYVGGDRFILEGPWSGGRAAVTGLPGSSSAQWRSLTAYEGGRLLAVRDTQSATQNIALIADRQYVRTFRADGGPVVSIHGVLYLR